MFIDARTLPRDTELRADVCIVGAGAAGITLARELIGTHLDVCVLESGGLDLDPATQDLGQDSVGSVLRLEANSSAPLRRLDGALGRGLPAPRRH